MEKPKNFPADDDIAFVGTLAWLTLIIMLVFPGV